MNTMNTHTNAMSASAASQTIAPVPMPWTQILYWSIRRELWENRSIYIAPLAIAALTVFGTLISAFHLPARMRTASSLDPMNAQELIAQPYNFIALLLMGTSFIVAIFYCLDALHGERRDRGILFWKSLPVSDLMTVLSKASIPVLAIPLLTFVVTLATQWIVLLLSSAVLGASGASVAPLWRLPWLHMSWMLLYHLVALHGIYFAPIYGWLLLVSAWARRATFLWASLPLLALAVVEKIAFNTSHFGHMLGAWLGGGADAVPFPAKRGMSMDVMSHPAPVNFLLTPGLWIGLAIFAAFMVAAVRLRRSQGPI